MQNNAQALILVDLQNDYFPGGKNELENSPEAGHKAAQLLAQFRSDKLPIIHIQHLSTRPGATFFIPGTTGADIHESVTPLPGETLFQKHFPNSFRETPLLDHLHSLGIKQLIIAGMMTHMCIDATTRAANDFGFDCLLAHDGCATRMVRFKDEAIPASHVHGAFLAALGSYAKVLSVDEILAEMKM